VDALQLRLVTGAFLYMTYVDGSSDTPTPKEVRVLNGRNELGLSGAEIVFNSSATVAGLSEYLWKLEQSGARRG
jgi:hypothetical protein